MPTCIIDGKKVEFKAGENLVEVAKRVDVNIPVFCYHSGLSVVAQCRMCTIEIKGMPKLQTACSTEAKDGMEVFTKSDRATKQQEAVMEFLLVNHPLDCPICDKSGECDLQDHSYGHGSAYMRTLEDRRTYLDLDMGPVIEKNMNRCIHCTRCIRLGDEILGIREMVAIQRGNNTEITTLDGKPLQTSYAGNYADICPTGSLTLKDFRFKKRAWMLKKTPTVCEGCSKGCNMEVHQDANVIYRCLPKTNMEINRYWLCDDGRFNYHYLVDPARVRTPWARGSEITESSALQNIQGLSKSGATVFLAGSDLTSEELTLLQDYSKKLKAPLFHFGTPGVGSAAEDKDEDGILKRASKTSNLHGAEKVGLRHMDEGKTELQKAQTIVIFRGGRAQLPTLSAKSIVGIGVFKEEECKTFQVVLPGFGFAEKTGTIVNYQGKEQKLQKAIQGPRDARPLQEWLELWTGALASGAA